MAEKKIFVGRRNELEQFKKVLEDPQGQAILVVGNRGMGKTWLINKMAEVAENHPDLKCGCVRYEVTKEDSVDSRLAIMMDDAFEAASNPGKWWGGDDRGKKQWIAMYKILEAIPIKGKVFEAIRNLAASLKRDTSKDTRLQFIEKLKLISRKMPDKARAIFVVDPEKYMKPESDEAWAIVVRDLPKKIKLVFTQRPEDVLVESETFDGLDNVVCIPDEKLDVLEEEAVDELLNQRIGELEYSVTEVRKVLSRYEGYPYALGAALDLLQAGIKLEELPDRPEPTKFAEKQWQKVCDNKDGAIELFEAYAILEVGVFDDVVEHVSGLKPAKRKRVMAYRFIRGLLREETDGRRIYHAILADYILGQIGEAEMKGYHGRAVDVYREKLKKAKKEQTKPDALSAMRLAEHVLAAEGEKAFVDAFVNECGKALMNIGLLDAFISLSEQALKVVEKDSEEEATVTGNLGLIYRTRGELDKAEEMHKKALEIEERMGRLEGMASDYGNLGLVYRRRGDLDKAEEMHNKSLEIAGKLGLQEIMASDYGNLGLIYQTRGDLDKAEEMFKESLKISEPKGMMELTANQYGNLGNVYFMGGELDKAEEMYNKSLEIEKKLGRLEGMADDYVNLGTVYKQRGHIENAREYWEKALALFKKIGMPHMVEKVKGWIEELVN